MLLLPRAGDRVPRQYRWEHRRNGIINAIACKYSVLVEASLLDALLEMPMDPVVAVSEAVKNMGADEIVLTIEHFEVH